MATYQEAILKKHLNLAIGYAQAIEENANEPTREIATKIIGCIERALAVIAENKGS